MKNRRSNTRELINGKKFCFATSSRFVIIYCKRPLSRPRNFITAINTVFLVQIINKCILSAIEGKLFDLLTSKMFEIYQLGLSDWRILAMVFGIVVIDVVLLVAWELTDPLQHEETVVDKKVSGQITTFSNMLFFQRISYTVLVLVERCL